MLQEKTFEEYLLSNLRNIWGNSLEISRYTKISQRASSVHRVFLKGSRLAPSTVIAKHISIDEYPAKSLPSVNLEFAEEQLVYVFLNQIEANQRFYPQLVQADPGGILFCEDLGREPYTEQRTYGELIPLLAHALAKLHYAARDKYDLYLKLRKESGLGDRNNDHRRYGLINQSRLFERGKEFILKQSVKMQTTWNSNDLENELICIESIIQNPGPFFTLIHDDLGNARQTFEVGNDLYLLDFEYAKYSHALLDFCKIILGKFEVNLKTGMYGWTNPGFPLQLAGEYRRFQCDMFGIRYQEDEWNHSLSAALIYGTLILIGRLMCLEPERTLAGSVVQNINAIFLRLLQVLEKRDEFPFVKGFMASWVN